MRSQRDIIIKDEESVERVEKAYGLKLAKTEEKQQNEADHLS